MDNATIGEITDRKEKIKACKVEGVWQTLSKKWALQILANLSSKESTRFIKIKNLVPGITNSVLSERLDDLERESLVTKKIYPEIPPRVEYRLTTQAKDFEKILFDLEKWIDKWNKKKLK